MIPWPFKKQIDREGLDRAKQQLEVAKAIEHHSAELAEEHRNILRRNNLGPKIHKALGGN